jgi:hypothetical protein
LNYDQLPEVYATKRPFIVHAERKFIDYQAFLLVSGAKENQIDLQPQYPAVQRKCLVG